MLKDCLTASCLVHPCCKLTCFSLHKCVCSLSHKTGQGKIRKSKHCGVLISRAALQWSSGRFLTLLARQSFSNWRPVRAERGAVGGCPATLLLPVLPVLPVTKQPKAAAPLLSRAGTAHLNTLTKHLEMLIYGTRICSSDSSLGASMITNSLRRKATQSPLHLKLDSVQWTVWLCSSKDQNVAAI